MQVLWILLKVHVACNIVFKGSELQATDPMNKRNQYIDPCNYMDLMELISTFTNELDRRDTKLEGMIGQGRYYFLTAIGQFL